jgi:hypothetical protein
MAPLTASREDAIIDDVVGANVIEMFRAEKDDIGITIECVASPGVTPFIHGYQLLNSSEQLGSPRQQLYLRT